jgi:hypothetical protein
MVKKLILKKSDIGFEFLDIVITYSEAFPQHRKDEK